MQYFSCTDDAGPAADVEEYPKKKNSVLLALVLIPVRIVSRNAMLQQRLEQENCNKTEARTEA
jgi:hypothetical protein